MADKQRDGFPVVPVFTAGEQITASKLSAWAAQTDRGMGLLEYSVGDIHGHSWPYFSGAAISYTPTGLWAFNRTGTALGTVQRHLQIPNLGRAIGPMSALNPRILPGTEQVLKWELPSGRSDFHLPFIPKSGAAITFTDAVVFQTLVGSAEEVIAEGDYFVSSTGRVNCFYPTGYSGGSLLVTFTVNVDEANASDSYPGSTYNVIPDPNQTTVRCTVAALAANKQLITFPVIDYQQANFEELTSQLSDPNPGIGFGAEDLNYQETPTLPSYMDTVYSVGDPIAEGLIYVWDNIAGSRVLGLTVYYESLTSVRVANGAGTAALEVGSDRYSIFVAGTDVARTLDFLRWRHYAHTHSQGDGSRPVSHDDLDNLFDTWVTNLAVPSTTRRPFRKSSEPGHPHPQYLHRGGYDSLNDGGELDGAGEGANWGGALLGNLRIGNLNIYDGQDNTSVVGIAGDVVALRKNSFRLEFTTSANSVGWRQIDWDGVNDYYAMHYTGDIEPDQGIAVRYAAWGTRNDSGANWFKFFGTVQIAAKSNVPAQGYLEVENGIKSGDTTGEHLKWWSGTGSMLSSFLRLDGATPPLPNLSTDTVLGFSLLLQSSADPDLWFPPHHNNDVPVVDAHYYDAYLDQDNGVTLGMTLVIINRGASIPNDAAYRLVVWYI